MMYHVLNLLRIGLLLVSVEVGLRYLTLWLQVRHRDNSGSMLYNLMIGTSIYMMGTAMRLGYRAAVPDTIARMSVADLAVLIISYAACIIAVCLKHVSYMKLRQGYTSRMIEVQFAWRVVAAIAFGSLLVLYGWA